MCGARTIFAALRVSLFKDEGAGCLAIERAGFAPCLTDLCDLFQGPGWGRRVISIMFSMFFALRGSDVNFLFQGVSGYRRAIFTVLRGSVVICLFQGVSGYRRMIFSVLRGSEDTDA